MDHMIGLLGGIYLLNKFICPPNSHTGDWAAYNLKNPQHKNHEILSQSMAAATQSNYLFIKQLHMEYSPSFVHIVPTLFSF